MELEDVFRLWCICKIGKSEIDKVILLVLPTFPEVGNAYVVKK